ncbi:AAA family ATPase, partial [Bradyrhizobium sp. NBAIM08]|uniref:AAA family ATPase n=1 Tax=Bradyrhizobium sp. NBAIM08 TaxID=2793815 RepID=UPI001CD52132
MTAAIVGREDEVGALCAFFDGEAASGSAALALEGEAGIGKSTLWRAAVEEARGRGLRVLSTRTVESERALAHVGLGDLLDDVLDEVLPALSLPRRRALEVALLVAEAEERRVDSRALGVAVRT